MSSVSPTLQLAAQESSRQPKTPRWPNEELADRHHGTWYAYLKRSADFTLAVIILVVTSPVLAISMLLVKLTSPGPVIYQQLRLGKNGLPFVIYKIRSMRIDAEDLTGAKWSTPGDSRITFIGRILRKLHIDELPQLWNVLRGDMSLIGPRPERPEFVPGLELKIPHYRVRLLVRPGVTGLAQVQLPADSNMKSVRRKIKYDIYYVRHAGLWLDCRLLGATALKIVHVPFRVIRGVCCFPKHRTVHEGYRELHPN